MSTLLAVLVTIAILVIWVICEFGFALGAGVSRVVTGLITHVPYRRWRYTRGERALAVVGHIVLRSPFIAALIATWIWIA